MISSNVTSLEEEEGENVDGPDRDKAKQVGGVADPNCLNLNYASLCLTVAMSMAHM